MGLDQCVLSSLTGLGFTFAPLPSDNSLGYFRASLRDVGSRHANHVPCQFSQGGAGDLPAPPGDPPGGMVVIARCVNTVNFRSMPLPVPSGKSPDCTGGSPVL